MNEELENALEAVVMGEARRESILAFCEAVRKEPHAECILPIYAEFIEAQAIFDTALVELADTGRMLLSTLDTE